LFQWSNHCFCCGCAEFSQDGDKYPDWPIDLDEQPEDSEWWMTAVGSARAFGNDYFKVSNNLQKS
jgi:peptidyl-prolyl isomerase D